MSIIRNAIRSSFSLRASDPVISRNSLPFLQESRKCLSTVGEQPPSSPSPPPPGGSPAEEVKKPASEGCYELTRTLGSLAHFKEGCVSFSRWLCFCCFREVVWEIFRLLKTYAEEWCHEHTWRMQCDITWSQIQLYARWKLESCWSVSSSFILMLSPLLLQKLYSWN